MAKIVILKFFFFQTDFIHSNSGSVQLFPRPYRSDFRRSHFLWGPNPTSETRRLETLLPSEFETRFASGFESEMLRDLKRNSLHLQPPPRPPGFGHLVLRNIISTDWLLNIAEICLPTFWFVLLKHRTIFIWQVLCLFLYSFYLLRHLLNLKTFLYTASR